MNRRAIQRAGDANIDMIDEHAYHNNTWPRQNFNYFDRYSREVRWTVFVGEYASQEATGNWGGGMGDAVYLMMIEPNGNLVKMATYAPLFVNINDRTWAFNLIEYDSSRSFAGHGSYYVQKAFNENRPDVNLAMTSEFSPAAEVPGRGGRRGRRGDAAAAAGGQPAEGGGRRRGRGDRLPCLVLCPCRLRPRRPDGDRQSRKLQLGAGAVRDHARRRDLPSRQRANTSSSAGTTCGRTTRSTSRGESCHKSSSSRAWRKKFTVTLTPNSVNVLRIPAQKFRRIYPLPRTHAEQSRPVRSDLGGKTIVELAEVLLGPKISHCARSSQAEFGEGCTDFFRFGCSRLRCGVGVDCVGSTSAAPAPSAAQ